MVISPLSSPVLDTGPVQQAAARAAAPAGKRKNKVLAGVATKRMLMKEAKEQACLERGPGLATGLVWSLA